MDTKEILITIIGFGVSIYGTLNDKIENQLFYVVSGILIIILAFYLNLSEQENEIKILKAQINTKSELNNLWREIDKLKKNDKRKKR